MKDVVPAYEEGDIEGVNRDFRIIPHFPINRQIIPTKRKGTLTGIIDSLKGDFPDIVARKLLKHNMM